MIVRNPFRRRAPKPAETAPADGRAARERYLALMQDCLTNRVYEDDPIAMAGAPKYDAEARDRGLDWPSRAHTMIGTKRMANLRSAVETVIAERVPGDLIEAGVWRGGACIFMRAILAAYEETGRRVWVADSFAGVPPPDRARYPADARERFHEFPDLAVSLEAVKANFAKYGLLDDRVSFLKGWFKDTLPGAPIEKLAVLRVDGDLYESTMDALVHLYDKLSVGGFAIVDDYGMVEACRKATDDFRASRGIPDPLQPIDGVGVFWRKSGATSRPRALTAPEAEPSARSASVFARGMTWDGDAFLRVDDVSFSLTCDIAELLAARSTENRFVLGKSRAMVEDSVVLARRRKIDKIFEMGVFKGGSVVLNDLIFAPSRLVAVELAAPALEPLARYIEKKGKGEVVKPYYGIDQSDHPAMEAILSREFPERDIDLVVDDASHLYEQTRAAFNVVFPYLRPGGLYVIEDWAWAHWAGDFWQKDNPHFAGKPALSNLLIELFMLSASRPGWIEKIEAISSAVTVTKGPAPLPPGPFDIREHYLLRGKKFTAPL